MIKYRIKEIALDQNLDLSQLAEKAHLMRVTILPLWYNDGANPLVDTLEKIATALNVTLANLIDEETK